MKDQGWISLHRKIRDHWIWKDPVKLKWWIDILMEVNHSDNMVNLGNQLIECKRGQSVMSLSSWAKRWGVTKDKARNFFVLLEKDNMITRENVVKSTRITVCNYNSYQDVSHANQTQTKRKLNTNNNDNNENNISYTNSNENYTFQEFWNDYDKRVGNKEKLAKLWSKISDDDKQKIKIFIPRYKAAKPDKQYRLNPEKFLIDKRWNDEAIESKPSFEPTKRYKKLG